MASSVGVFPAANQHHMYDDIEEPEELGYDEQEAEDDEDVFEDASEYLDDSGDVEGVVSDGFKKGAVEVETVDEKSDDSFHSWN